jgi:hypothetical protein
MQLCPALKSPCWNDGFKELNEILPTLRPEFTGIAPAARHEDFGQAANSERWYL